MLRSLKKVVSAMIILTLVLSISLMPVEAKQTKEKNTSTEVIHVRFPYIDYY